MSDTIRVITNNVPRPVIEAYELTSEERAEFDYYDWAKVETGEESATFFRYKGDLHDLGEFMHTGDLHQAPELRAWDGYRSDSFFSGLVIRWPREDRGPNREPDVDFEHVIVGLYLA